VSLLLEGGKAYVGGRLINADILCEDGKIKKIGRGLKGDKTINAQGKIILPGVIDTHVHFRVPGAEYKEDWKTASRASVKGGVTTVLDMPNNMPSITTAKLLDEKRKTIL